MVALLLSYVMIMHRWVGGKWECLQTAVSPLKNKVQARKKETIVIDEVIIESLPWINRPISPLQIHSIMAILCYLVIKILFFATLGFVTFKNNTFFKQENEQ